MGGFAFWNFGNFEKSGPKIQKIPFHYCPPSDRCTFEIPGILIQWWIYGFSPPRRDTIHFTERKICMCTNCRNISLKLIKPANQILRNFTYITGLALTVRFRQPTSAFDRLRQPADSPYADRLVHWASNFWIKNSKRKWKVKWSSNWRRTVNDENTCLSKLKKFNKKLQKFSKLE